MSALPSVLLWTSLALGAPQAPAAAKPTAKADDPSADQVKADSAPLSDKQPPARKRGAEKPAAKLPEYAVADLQALVNQPAKVLLATGEKLEDMQTVSFASGRGQATFKSVSIKTEKGDKRRTVRSAALSRLEVSGKPYAVVFVPDLRGHVLIDIAARDAAIDARLKPKGFAIWPELSPAAQEAALSERRELLNKARQAFPRLAIHETKFFLFASDLPADSLAPFVRDLDAMYARLADVFGVAKGVNIWRGKAVIVMFAGRADLWRFDQQVMKVDSSVDAQARCHWSTTGDVTITGYSGDDPKIFAHVLVHETAHGFTARHRSSVPLPAWVNEGIAEWVAGVIVPAAQQTKLRQQRSIQRLRQTGSLEGDFFGMKTLYPWRYGVASALVEYLLRIDAAAYRQFVDGIKEGATPDESLQAAYGFSKEELVARFGREIGVLNLAP